MHAVNTRGLLSLLFRFGQRRKQQGGDESDNRDDHQKLDQGEGPSQTGPSGVVFGNKHQVGVWHDAGLVARLAAVRCPMTPHDTKQTTAMRFVKKTTPRKPET